VYSTTAPDPTDGRVKVTDPWNGPIEVLPPVTKPVPTGAVASSARTRTCTVPSKAMLMPVTVSGDETAVFQVGADRVMPGVAAPTTHQFVSDPSWRTSTVVTGPVGFGWTGTSPDRESPCRKAPTVGPLMWR